MKLIQIYDPPMCCSTGVCGPDVDPKLVQFAADVKWLTEQGATVERFNLAQTPIAFAENDLVRTALTEKGEAALPLIVVEGKVAVSGAYPTREELASLLGLSGASASLFTPAVAELVAIGAAIAANCDPCLRYHEGEAKKLGISTADVGRAVELAAKVKDAPHRNIMRLAAKLTQTEPAAAVATPGTGFDGAAASGNAAKGSCCS
jgi:AhpD family alkylhydroperoxidase